MSLHELEQSVLDLSESAVSVQQGIYSFHEDGDAQVRLLCVKQVPRFFTVHHSSGELHTGDVTISPLSTFIELNSLGTVIVDDAFLIDGPVIIHDKLMITPTGKITVTSHGSLFLNPESTLELGDHLNIEIQEGGQVNIKGSIEIDVSQVVDFKKIPHLTIDTSAVFHVRNLNIPDRLYSFTDYLSELDDQDIPRNTIGSHDTAEGRMTYLGVSPDDVIEDQFIVLDSDWGTTILGDFKLSVLGFTKNPIGGKTIIASLTIKPESNMIISDHFTPEGSTKEVPYLYPELYVGRQYNNSLVPGLVDVQGSLRVIGKDASITLSDGGALRVSDEGHLTLSNDARIRIVNSTDPVLMINGTMMVDSMDQLVGFQAENIRFGPNGLLIVRNFTSGILFSISKKKELEIYQLCGDQLDHVQYHIPYGCGILIDEYHEYYYKDMPDWWGGLRLEEAIQNKMISWHVGAFIALDVNTIPWAKGADLNKVAHLFYADAADEEQYLQSVVDRLIDHGVKSIEFRIMNGSRTIQNMVLNLDPVAILGLVGYPNQRAYKLTTDQESDLFLRNRIAQPSTYTLIHHQSEHHILTEGDTDIEIPVSD